MDKSSKMRNTKILNVNADWTAAKNECRNTVNKDATNNKPSSEFIHKLLVSEHSPIRLITIRWRWEKIKSWVSVHFARHWLGWDKWVSTQRTDRTGVNRDELPQNALVNMDINANAQALINVARYRLCYQASPETRKYMENLKQTIKDIGQVELSDVMVPNCIYRCGCPEFTACGYFDKFCKWYSDQGYPQLADIHERYEGYNKYFYREENI